MRLRYAIAALAALLLCAQAPQVRFPPGVFQNRAPLDAPPAGGRTCSDSTASGNFLARVMAPSDALADAYCNMIKSLEANSLITGDLSGATGCGSVLNGLYIWATQDTTTANLNICGTSFGITPSGSPTFTASRGYTGNASNMFLDSGTATAGTQNSSHIGAYVLTSRTSMQTYAEAGCSGTGNLSSTYVIPRFSDGNYYLAVNSVTAGAVANANAQGLWINSRTGATTVNAYKNGNTTAIISASDVSTGVCSSTISFLATNDDSTGRTAFSADELSAGFFGFGLSSVQMANMASAINGFMTAQGINVY